MNANIQLLYSSPLVKISDFRCLQERGTVSRLEWTDSYHISFVRKGNFGYQAGSNFCDIHSGVILLENADTEYTVCHEHHIKDECTTFCIAETLLNDIFAAVSHPGQLPNLKLCSTGGFRFPSSVIPSTPELDHLHMLIYQSMLSPRGKSLAIDLLATELLQHILAHFTESRDMKRPIQLDKKLKDLHLETIDRGKTYILNHFQREMNLTDIAQHAYVSPFHFSRLFKHFTSSSPYQYLLNVRLNHAVTLLRETSFTVTEICFESGFQSLEHFIASFKRRHGLSPLKFRRNCS